MKHNSSKINLNIFGAFALLSALLLPCELQAQSPVISNVQVLDIEHSSVRITFNVSPDANVQIWFDTASNSSTPSKYKYASGAHNTSGNFGSIALGALKSSTTYSFVVTARPNLNDTIGMTVSPEMKFTTSASPAHPVPPVAPTVFAPHTLDLTGYTHVNMVQGNASGSAECVAASHVAAPAGNTSWSGDVMAGYTVQQVLNVVGYGTVLEFAQGAVCHVPPLNVYNGGYQLVPKPIDPQAANIDDPKHRWIVIETNRAGATGPSFPPDGFRTSPEWDSVYATFVANTPTLIMYTAGQHFQAAYSETNVLPGNSHHYAIRNVTLKVDPNVSGAFGAYVNFGGNCTAPWIIKTPPAYFTIDQVHFVGAPLSTLARSVNAITGCPSHVAIRGNLIEGFDAPGYWSQSIYFSDQSRGFYNIDNNFLQGVSQNVYFESNGFTVANNDDVSMTHNYLSWPLTAMKGSPTWDGRERILRNQFETKRSRRLSMVGNIIDGQFAFMNEGSAIFLSGNGESYLGETGVTDVNIQNNIVRHAANVFNCFATRGAQPQFPDNSVIRRVQFRNNLAYDLGRHYYTYQGWGGSLYSGYIIDAPGCQDLNINHNTFGYTDADSGNANFEYIPHILAVGLGAQLGEGFYFQNNIAHMSVGNPPDRFGIFVDTSQGQAAFPRLPAINYSAGPATALATSMVTLDGTTSQGIASGTWKNNVIIGGKYGASGQEPWPDLGTTTAQYAAKMPAGDTYAAGSTMLQREQAAGLIHIDRDDYTCTATSQNPPDSNGACSAGANVQQILNSAGVVTALSVSTAATHATVTYSAPDTRACSLDYGAGTSKFTTRVADNGGGTSRSLRITGLTPKTSYSYRLMCYFEQGPQALVPDGVPTSGTFTTGN